MLGRLENIVEYLNENHEEKMSMFGERMSLVNKTLNELLEEVIENTQDLQLNKRYNEAITSIKIQEELNKVIQLNYNIIGELTPSKKEVIDYGEHKADENIAYTLKDDFKFKRPYKFKLGKHEEEITTWKEMLIKTCEYLNKLNPTLFDSFTRDKSMQWGDTFNFSKDKELLRGPVKISNSDVFVETNKDSIAVRQIVAKMLDKFGINKEEYKVFIRADYTDKRIERKH